ncbi:MAG: hypothetical protein GY788_06635 [bacterium]|nr:hypothetical protein [bacterium]
MKSNDVPGSEIELISWSAPPALALPADARLAVVAERLVHQARTDGGRSHDKGRSGSERGFVGVG